MTHSKSIADYVNQVHQLLKTTEAKNINAAIGNLTYAYAGPANRFVRQAICSHLTGANTPIVKSGISHLADYSRAYVKRLTKDGVEGVDYPNGLKPEKQADKAPKQADKAKKQSDSAPATAKVGFKVVRKACQRKGEVTAIEGNIVIVTLEDGSVRKPNSNRFTKLYNAA